METDKYLTVTALNKYIKRKFDVDPYLGNVYLSGEISNFRMRPNSHQYFSLKDEHSKISVVMFKSSFSKLTFVPEEGMKVFVKGRVSVYEPSGSYQITIDSMQPDGVGTLYLALEQLKKKLSSEGVFDLPKKPIPKFPKQIAIITSESGAVIRDIITTAKRRYPLAKLVLYPALVQGEKASEDIVRQIERVNKKDSFDTLIIGRGGGSIEDLWPFNEEIVARAILSSNIPVISSVGHETDTTIADMVADKRAPTPTAAAELATPDQTHLMISIKEMQARIVRVQTQKIKNYHEDLKKIISRPVFKNPIRLYDIYLQKIDQLNYSLKSNLRNLYINNRTNFDVVKNQLNTNSPQKIILDNKNRLNYDAEKLINNMKTYLVKSKNTSYSLIEKLDNLSPLKILTRGYSVVSQNQNIITHIEDIKENDEIDIQLSNGQLKAVVEEVIKDGK